MASETPDRQAGERQPGKAVAVLVGSVLIMLTTTIPYLTLVNAFLFAGIIFGGWGGTYYHIIRHQVRLDYGEAFLLGALCGLGGGVLSVMAGYLLLVGFDYRPGLESLVLLAEWGSRVAPEEAGTFRQLLQAVTAPVELTAADILMSMAMSGMIYAPFAGLGGRIAVFILKRQARQSAQTS
jgi:hypothetical protein